MLFDKHPPRSVTTILWRTIWPATAAKERLGGVPSQIDWRRLKLRASLSWRLLRDHLGLTGRSLYAFALWPGSAPLRVLHETFKLTCQSKAVYVERWSTTFLITISVLLLFAGSLPAWLQLCVCLLLTMRMFDIIHTLFYLSLVQKARPRSTSRSLLLLMVHYAEVVGTFATFYVVMADRDLAIFLDKSGNVLDLSWLQGLYFSFITGATIGYGDISPHVSGNGLILALIPIETALLFFITLIEVPRLLAFHSLPVISRRGTLTMRRSLRRQSCDRRGSRDPEKLGPKVR